MQFCSNFLEKYDPLNVYNSYTKKSLQILSEYQADNNNPLLDSYFPNNIDQKYCEHIEKKIRKQINLVSKNPKITETKANFKKSQIKKDLIISTRSRNRKINENQEITLEKPKENVENLCVIQKHYFKNADSKICEVCNEENSDCENNLLIQCCVFFCFLFQIELQYQSSSKMLWNRKRK